MKTKAPVNIEVRCLRLAILLIAAGALGLLFNAVNPDGIPLARTGPSVAGR